MVPLSIGNTSVPASVGLAFVRKQAEEQGAQALKTLDEAIQAYFNANRKDTDVTLEDVVKYAEANGMPLSIDIIDTAIASQDEALRTELLKSDNNLDNGFQLHIQQKTVRPASTSLSKPDGFTWDQFVGYIQSGGLNGTRMSEQAAKEIAEKLWKHLGGSDTDKFARFDTAKLKVLYQQVTAGKGTITIDGTTLKLDPQGVEKLYFAAELQKLGLDEPVDATAFKAKIQNLLDIPEMRKILGLGDDKENDGAFVSDLIKYLPKDDTGLLVKLSDITKVLKDSIEFNAALGALDRASTGVQDDAVISFTQVSRGSNPEQIGVAHIRKVGPNTYQVQFARLVPGTNQYGAPNTKEENVGAPITITSTDGQIAQAVVSQAQEKFGSLCSWGDVTAEAKISAPEMAGVSSVGGNDKGTRNSFTVKQSAYVADQIAKEVKAQEREDRAEKRAKRQEIMQMVDMFMALFKSLFKLRKYL